MPHSTVHPPHLFEPCPACGRVFGGPIPEGRVCSVCVLRSLELADHVTQVQQTRDTARLAHLFGHDPRAAPG